jgi:predicted nucleic acid-binding protein
VTLVYLDTSVVLAQLLAEDRCPPPALWTRPLVASRLLEYEAWVRLNALGLGASHGDAARDLLGRVAFVELNALAMARALEPFPVPLRTLDALHLAAIEFLRGRGQAVELASYDARLIAAAQQLGIPITS